MPAPPPDATDSPSPHAQQQALRDHAETRRRLLTQATAPLTPEATQRLVQELQVHQIELEMQCEQLLLVQAEAEAARAQYVDLYEFAPVGYFTLGESGLIDQLNLCGTQLLGLERQRLLGRRFALFVALAQREAFGQFLARVFGTDTPQRIELPLWREGETMFYGLLEGRRVTTPTGPQCRLAVLDVTAHRRATDAALAASEARFRKLFTDSHDAMVLLQGHQLVDCNAAALRLLGAQHREQLVGQPAWVFTPEYQPAGRRSVDLLRHIIDQAVAGGPTRYELLMHRATGAEIWVEAVLTPIEQGGVTPLVHMVWRDITAARAAARQRRDSEARLSLALTASQTGVFTWDFAARQVEGDATVQAMFGRASVPGVVGLAAIEARIHPHDRSRVWGGLQAATAVQETLALGFRVVWPDASVHYLSLAGRVVANAEGHASSFTGVLRDVTRQRAADEELHYKSLVLERLLSRLPMVLSRIRPDGTYLESTGAGLEAVGLAQNELVSQNVYELFPAVQSVLAQVLHGGQAEFLVEMPAPAGGVVSSRNYAFFDEQGQQVVVLAVDVTAAEQQRRQLQAEKEFTRSLLETSIDCIIALDQHGRITVWNAEATRYFGRSAAEVQGQPLFGVVPALGEYAQREVARALAGERIDQFNQAFELRPGRYDVHLVPLPLVESQPGGVLIILRDVTERERLAEEATQLRLRQQQEVLAAILTTQETERKRIAEALHNGLGQLLYAAKLSLDGPGGVPPAPRDALHLLEEAIRSTRFISFELTPGILEDFGLRTALEALVRRIAPARLPVHLHLVNLDQRLPPPVEIAVYRTVQELLNNVMKHAAATEVEVHVAREAHRLHVSVEDNGGGFEPAVLEAAPLVGIGLAGVRNRVALLGGELAVRSQPGRGTIISFEVEV